MDTKDRIPNDLKNEEHNDFSKLDHTPELEDYASSAARAARPNRDPKIAQKIFEHSVKLPFWKAVGQAQQLLHQTSQFWEQSKHQCIQLACSVPGRY